MNKHFRYHNFSKNQKLTFLSTAIGTSLENMDILFLSFSMAFIVAEFHISNVAGGLMFTISRVSSLIGGIVFGMLADTFSRVKIFTYTLALIAIATATMFFAKDMTVIYICRCLVGLGSGGEGGVGITLIAENFHGHKIGSLISNASSIGQFGIIIASCLSAIILPVFGWRPLFLIGLAPIILVFIVRRHLKENPAFIRDVKVRKKEHHQRAPFSRLFKTPKIAYRTIALAIMAAILNANYAFMSWIPDIMKKELKMGTSASSLLMIGIIVGLMIGFVVFGKIMDYYGVKPAFTIFLIGSALVVYLLKLPLTQFPVSPFVSLMIVDIFIGFFLGSAYSGFGVIISRLYPMDIRVTANSLINGTGSVVGGGLMALAVGYLMDNYSLTGVLVSITVLSIISLCILPTIPGIKSVRS